MDLFLSILLQIIISDMHITETVLDAAWIFFYEAICMLMNE